MVAERAGFEPERSEPKLRTASRSNPKVDLLRKSGEFLMRYEELDDAAATVYEGI
jgi:hypothetical protein